VSAALLGIYVVDNHSRTGVWGLTKADAFNPYLRVASFAHCVGWRPPVGTQPLCSRRVPPAALWKPGPFVWACLSDPGVCQFGDPPDANSKLSAFTQAAIWHQPGDYLSAVTTDVSRFIAPPRGASQGDLLRLLHSSFWVPPNVHEMASYYSERSAASTASSAPVAYALAVHSTGATIAILIILGLASVPLCQGRERAMTVLLAATGLTLLVASVATATYQPRFALPALAPLSAASALALSGAITRIHERRTRPSGATGGSRR